jgi:ribosomal protein L16 Arg81 hydroxylase
MTDPHPLTTLVVDSGMFGDDNWNKRHVLVKQAVPVSAFIGADDIQHIIDRPLLRRPYFSVLKQGVWAHLDKVTHTDRAGGAEITGLATAAGIREALAQGGTLKLNQLEDWHRPTRDLVRELEATVAAELKSYIFFTPSENTGMRPHRDGSHVLAVQLVGAKKWRLYATEGRVDARAGLVDVDPDDFSHEFVMEPGDVLYLPHGYPHAASAQDDDSLHLTLTITEPGPLELLEALLETFAADNQQLMREQARLFAGDKPDAVAKALITHVQQVDADRLLTTALHQMRRRIA